MTKNITDTVAEERWDAIPGYAGAYEISTEGRVRRAVDSPQARSYAGRILKPILQNTGYLTVTLYKMKIPKTLSIHRLVAITFLGEDAAARHVHHIDGNKTNNSLANLRYVTQKENSEQAATGGMYKTGSHHHAAKLTEDGVLDIVRSITDGKETRVEAAARYGVTDTNIGYIMRGETWWRLTGIKKE